MSIEFHRRNPSSYVPPVTKKLGLERYSNRPHRSDRPFGFDGYDEHVGFNHYDRVEQEWSQREKKRRFKREEMDSGSERPDSCDLQQVPKINQNHVASSTEQHLPLDMSKPKQEISDDAELKTTLPKFETIFDYSVLYTNPYFDANASNSKVKLEDDIM